MLILIIVVSF